MIALLKPRMVAGMPALASAPKAEVTPGRMRNGMPARGQRQRLLAAAAENVGVAALQPQHPRTVAGQLDQQRGDVVLACDRRLAAALADEVHLRAFARPPTGSTGSTSAS